MGVLAVSCFCLKVKQAVLQGANAGVFVSAGAKCRSQTASSTESPVWWIDMGYRYALSTESPFWWTDVGDRCAVASLCRRSSP